MPDAAPRRAGSAVEAVATAAAGGALGGAAWSVLGLGWLAAAVGALNGLVSGWRGIYAWRRRTGPLAFVLDSTWAAVTTTGSLITHAVAALQRDRGGYLPDLSRRANRHVYARGFRIRRDFLITIGNTVHGAGEEARWSERRRRVVTDHEDVHVWQARWFGPLYPLLYGGWMLAGAAAGTFVWLARGRRDSLGKVVETCAYYLNPFEWWAYSRDGFWPPSSKVAGLGWKRPCVQPLSASPRRLSAARRPVPPTPPAALD